MRQEKPGQEFVVDAKKLQYPSLSLANIQTLKIRELDPDPYSSDEEVKYVSLETPIDGIGVLATCIN